MFSSCGHELPAFFLRLEEACLMLRVCVNCTGVTRLLDLLMQSGPSVCEWGWTVLLRDFLGNSHRKEREENGEDEGSYRPIFLPSSLKRVVFFLSFTWQESKRCKSQTFMTDFFFLRVVLFSFGLGLMLLLYLFIIHTLKERLYIPAVYTRDR